MLSRKLLLNTNLYGDIIGIIENYYYDYKKQYNLVIDAIDSMYNEYKNDHPDEYETKIFIKFLNRYINPYVRIHYQNFMLTRIFHKNINDDYKNNEKIRKITSKLYKLDLIKKNIIKERNRLLENINEKADEELRKIDNQYREIINKKDIRCYCGLLYNYCNIINHKELKTHKKRTNEAYYYESKYLYKRYELVKRFY